MLTPAQLELRKRGIGSSESAAVLDIHPEDSPIDVWLAKMGEEDEGNEQTEIGNHFEAPIGAIAARKLGMVAVANPNQTRVQGVMVSTVDFRLYKQIPEDFAGPFEVDRIGILETKNVGYQMMGNWDADVEDDSGPPEHVIVQVQHQLEVEEEEIAYVGALLGGRDHRVYGPIRRDREVGAWIRRSCEDFWERYVVRKEPPPLDGSKAGWRALERVHGPGRPGLVPAGEALLRELEELRELKAEEAKIAAAVDVKRQRVAQLIGDAEAVIWFEGKVRRVMRYAMQRGKVSWKAVAVALGATDEIAEKHRGAPGRVLTLPKGWAAEKGE